MYGMQYNERGTFADVTANRYTELLNPTVDTERILQALDRLSNRLDMLENARKHTPLQQSEPDNWTRTEEQWYNHSNYNQQRGAGRRPPLLPTPTPTIPQEHHHNNRNNNQHIETGRRPPLLPNPTDTTTHPEHHQPTPLPHTVTRGQFQHPPRRQPAPLPSYAHRKGRNPVENLLILVCQR